MSGSNEIKELGIVIVGASRVGKGMYGKILGFFPLTWSWVFRLLDTSSELWQRFVNCSSRDELVLDEVTVKI